MRVELQGGQEVLRNLDQLSNRITRGILSGALAEAAEPMRRDMGRRAPHRPGKPDLRDEIVIKPIRGEDAREVAVAVGPAKHVFYGSFLEFGTIHAAARPFARPAFDANVDGALVILMAAIWRELAGRGVSRSVVVDEAVEDLGTDWVSQGTDDDL